MHANELTPCPNPTLPCVYTSPAFGLSPQDRRQERQIREMIARLREILLAPPTHTERFHVVFWDSARRVSGMNALGQGSQTALTVRIRDLFHHALKAEAAAILMAHTHPSGDCRPSKKDLESTKRIALIGRSLEIELLDHLIFSQNAVYSMRKRGQL